MNWSELKLSTNELVHNSHRLIPKDSHINNVIHCYFLFKVSECPVHHKANTCSLDLPYCKVETLIRQGYQNSMLGNIQSNDYYKLKKRFNTARHNT